MADELWKCARCQLIGTKEQAKRHTHLTGHKTEKLDDSGAESVRKIWAREGRHPADGHKL
jgi:hypothetical protein